MQRHGSLPISSGNGTNDVTKISKSDKKDNQLGSVTDGEELSDAELIPADTDFLSAEQVLNCLENDTKEGSDHSTVSGRSKEEGPVVEDSECGKEVTHDVQAEQEIEGNEEDEKKCKEVPQKKNRRTKRSQAKADFEGDNTEKKSNKCAKWAILKDWLYIFELVFMFI